MTFSGRESFDTTIHKTNTWLREIAEAMGTENRDQAFHALRGTLHALRDRLSIEETAHFAAQLPMLVRGIFYENWRPSQVPLSMRTANDFLERVQQEIAIELDSDVQTAVKAVCSVLERELAQGELSHVRKSMPTEIASLLSLGH